jgi:hypothetical protein
VPVELPTTVIEKRIIFISCGQRTADEKKLGDDITQLVRELTTFSPYFAEYQTSLEGLSKNIFGALNRCVGLIAILHRRGTVQPLDVIRASVWVEQEIAIAAFLQEALGRKLHVVAFSQEGVVREGVRENLLLNPKEFTRNSEILDHLRLVLPTWRVLSTPGTSIELSIQHSEKHITQERHDYQLFVLLTNRGAEPLARFHVDLEFPMGLLEQPRDNVLFVAERSNNSSALFRATQDAQRRTVFPGDTLRVMSFEYFVDNKIYVEHPELLRKTAKATLYLPGADPQVVERSLTELQNF